MVLSSYTAAKYGGLSEGEWGAAPLSADNTPSGLTFVKATLNPAETFRDGACRW